MDEDRFTVATLGPYELEVSRREESPPSGDLFGLLVIGVVLFFVVRWIVRG